MSDALVLCYHAVSDDWPSELAVTRDAFRRQLGMLVERGWRGVTFTEAATTPADGRVLAVTFDDAYRSVLDVASPILAEFGIPGTVFVPTEFVGTATPMSWSGIDQWAGTPHAAELVCLGWDGLRSLVGAGWEIGSHTRSHPRLTALTDDELLAELVESRRQIEKELGVACRSVAYPYGDHDDRVVRAAATAGYRAACTLPGVLHQPTALRYPRVGLYRGDGPIRERLKVSRFVRRVRTGRTGALVGVLAHR